METLSHSIHTLYLRIAIPQKQDNIRYSVRISVQTEQRLTCKGCDRHLCYPSILSGKGVISDISLLSNTVCACAIFTVDNDQKKKKNPPGADGTAGTVIAVPLLSRLTISRPGLYSRGRVASTWWRSIDECKRKAAHISLSWNFLRLTRRLPDSFFHSEPSVQTSFVLLCHG